MRSAEIFPKRWSVWVRSDSFALDNERAICCARPARRFGFLVGEPDHALTKEELAFLNSVMLSMGDQGWNRWESDQDQADGLRLGDDQSSLEFLFGSGLGFMVRARGSCSRFEGSSRKGRCGAGYARGSLFLSLDPQAIRPDGFFLSAGCGRHP